MTTHERESQLLAQDQGNYIATNPNRDTQKRKGGETFKQNIINWIIGYYNSGVFTGLATVVCEPCSTMLYKYSKCTRNFLGAFFS